MSKEKINFTQEQEASIKYRGGSLLVSAAAGSGKTRVLVERLLSHIDEGNNIDEFLVITYTRAAALELRERIYEQLLNRLSGSPGNTRLRRQSLLCRGAMIDTIHTFCAEVLRENAHLVKLPPDFRVADTSESDIIMSEVMDTLLGSVYERMDEFPGFNLLIEIVAGGRDDKQMVEILLDIYRKLQSLPNPRLWVEESVEKLKLKGVTDISETDCGTYMLEKLRCTVKYCKKEMLNLRDEMKHHKEFEAAYANCVDELIILIDAQLSAIDRGWDEARKFRITEFPRAKRVTGFNELKEIRVNCIQELKNCASELENSSEEHIEDMRLLSPAITALLQIVMEFDYAYAEEKRRRGVADFTDLEHLTLSLLIDKDTGVKTALAQSLSKRYKEIMVDEYQDVNAVQEFIFNAVSKNGENIFMVGDVKQAIYRFRLADPTIFLSKYKNFTEYTNGNENRKILNDSQKENSITKKSSKIHLSKNFRSCSGILEAVNHIFINIMSPEFGELEYTEKEQLIPGRTGDEGKQGKKGIPYIEADKDCNKSPVEIDIIDLIDLKTEDQEESPTAIQLEAKHIASRINELTNGSYLVPDGKGGERRAVYNDVVILLRSIKGRAWQYAEALSEIGIPTEFPGGEGFFETMEVTAALSLLTIIDNPLQDIPLATVLGGPVFGLSSDEMTEIRLASRKSNLYTALIRSAEPNTVSRETSLKCTKIISSIEELRSVKSDMPADRFIWHVYNKTGLLGLVSSFKGGEVRRNNLIQLAEHARRFEKSGYKGLFGFLTFIRDVRDRREDLTWDSDQKISVDDTINAVRIMSIHKSKGLEFPVVFLANTSKRHNYRDINKGVVFHKDFGIGTMLVDKKRKIKYSTLPRAAVKSKLTEEMLSEELRVLYVAMTRAREKLIVTATLKDAESKKASISLLPTGKMASQAISSMSMAEWILVGAREALDNEITIRTLPASQLKAESEEGELLKKKDVEMYQDSSITAKEPVVNDNANDKQPDLAFIYPYNCAPELPSKLTVTGLGKLSDPEAAKAAWIAAPPILTPGFISDYKALTAAERGTLLHHIMQHLDYNKGSDESDMRNELEHLHKSGVLTSEEVKEIDVSKIVYFFSSDLGKRIIKADSVKREFKFSILRPAENYFPGGGKDKVLLQGVVDCFFEENGELVVVDFKTDRVNEKTLNEKAQQYTPQLNAYADALHRITGKHVKERIIYFFSINSAYVV